MRQAELYPVAFNYGKTTEAWIGKWLAERVGQGTLKRNDIYIATKCNPMGIGGAEGDPKPHGFEADVLERSCRASIERMQCGYIDLYQLHWPSRDVPIFGCASFYPGATKNRPMPAGTPLPPGEPGCELDSILFYFTPLSRTHPSYTHAPPPLLTPAATSSRRKSSL